MEKAKQFFRCWYDLVRNHKAFCAYLNLYQSEPIKPNLDKMARLRRGPYGPGVKRCEDLGFFIYALSSSKRTWDEFWETHGSMMTSSYRVSGTPFRSPNIYQFISAVELEYMDLRPSMSFTDFLKDVAREYSDRLFVVDLSGKRMSGKASFDDVILGLRDELSGLREAFPNWFERHHKVRRYRDDVMEYVRAWKIIGNGGGVSDVAKAMKGNTDPDATSRLARLHVKKAAIISKNAMKFGEFPMY